MFCRIQIYTADDSCYYTLNNFTIYRYDEPDSVSASRPYHGLVLYVKNHLTVERVEKFRSGTCEFISVVVSCDTKGCFQVICLYKSPKSSIGMFKNDMEAEMMPLIQRNQKFVIIGDFNVDATNIRSEFVRFMTTLFKCRQYVQKPSTDFGSMLDLIFSNCPVFSDVIEAYWSDHKLIYCAFNKS